MPSKTSCFNKTALGKDLTRFFPLWGLYTLCLLLGLVLLADDGKGYWLASNFAGLCSAMAPINLVYALVAAAVLFGDLYNTRMCYGIHALPMSRGSWFVSHVLSGMLFSLAPTAIMALVAIPMLAGTPVTDAWQLSLYWFVAANGQYLFFFALAAFCAQCVGNWLGLAALYAVVNFGSIVVYILVNTLFIPLLPGVVISPDKAYQFSPVIQLAERYVLLEPVHTLDETGLVQITGGSFTLNGTGGWGDLLLALVLALALLAGAYLLYHRRKLERAGDFLAVRKLAGVMAVAMALSGAAAFQVVSLGVGLMSASRYSLLLFFSFACMAICWFAGLMLLSRNVQVFHLRSWAGLGILTLVMAAALGLTKLDVLGIASWVPEASDVKSVSFYCNTGDSLEDSQGIADMIQLHKICLEEGITNTQLNQQRREFYAQHSQEVYPYNYVQVNLNYHLANGSTPSRVYYIDLDSAQAGPIIQHYTGTLGALFSMYAGFSDVETSEDLMGYVTKPERLEVGSLELGEEYLTADTVRSLFQAIAADSQAGTLSQLSSFHPTWKLRNMDGDLVEIGSFNIYLALSDEVWLYLDVFPDCENLLAWMESVEITPELIASRYYG